MSGQVFGGEAQELFLALLKERCAQDGLGMSEEPLGSQLRLHPHRGSSYLATPHLIRSIPDLVWLAGQGLRQEAQDRGKRWTEPLGNLSSEPYG
jgi:hypothetical protein